MSEMRKIMESVEKIDEGYFSRLATELDELYRANPNTPDENLIAFVGRKYGEEAADYFRNQINSGEYEQSLEEESWPQEETFDEMVDYWKTSLSQSIVRKGLFTQLYDAANQDIDELNAAIAEEAYSIAESYHGSGEGIGSSDQNHFIASVARNLGIEDVFGWNKKESLGERIVKVPRGLRGSEGSDLTSADAEKFVNSLGPDDTVATEVVDPETGEVLDWPDRGTRRARGQKEWERQEKDRKSREAAEHEEGYDSPYLYVPGIKQEPERAWEGIETLKYDREFTDFYHIVWKSVEDLVDEPEQYYEGDYDIGIDIPVAIKRKDGKKFNKQDRKNFDVTNELFRAATFNIGVQYVGSSNNGTVARFIPSFH